MIVADRLTRFYGELPALQELTFTAHRGEILGFLGPNGAGKTTAMRILTGYMPPTSGTARVAGHDVVNESLSARRQIGYLPEHTPLYTDMTVAEYLSYMASLRDVRDRRAAVERVMKLTSVDHRADDLIGQLSKGYRQRVGIAQALVHDPAVIILDEPTIGLDPRQIREVRDLIQSLRGDHTVLLSTHILPEAQQVCDRVMIVNRGRVVAEDRPADLQGKMAGGERVRVGVAPALDAATVRAALAAVNGVQGVDSQGDGVFTVTATPGATPRSEIAEAVVGRGWPLLELSPLGVTLEDIFLELTAEDPQAEDAEEEMDG
jgi:ABC-2 type transport system ATP-binding protein